jgi:hypothetical protein
MDSLSLYEYRDLLLSNEGLYVQYIALYLTLLSGYLAVAYLVARKLTRFQLTLISLLYFVVMTGVVGMIVRVVLRELVIHSQIASAYGLDALEGPLPENLATPAIANAIVFGIGVLASLIYMWNARRQVIRT